MTGSTHWFSAEGSELQVKKAKAYAPSHVTGFFVAYRNGSTGAGVNLEEGVVTEVKVEESSRNRAAIMVNGKAKKLPTSRRVVREFTRLAGMPFSIKVNHRTRMPSGYGLGISGAMALSLSLALNKAIGSGLTEKECVDIAKEAEIAEGTGLGDVIAERFAGFTLGRKPYPSEDAEVLPLREKHVALAFFRPIKTKKVIRDRQMKRKINRAGLKCMRDFSRRKTPAEFTRLCNRFSAESGLLTKRLGRVMKEVPEASMAMLGETLFIITSRPDEAAERLKKHCRDVRVSAIAKKGAGLLKV
jgi:pantoate kinase